MQYECNAMNVIHCQSDCVTLTYFSLLSALKVFILTYGTVIMLVSNNNSNNNGNTQIPPWKQ